MNAEFGRGPGALDELMRQKAERAKVDPAHLDAPEANPLVKQMAGVELPGYVETLPQDGTHASVGERTEVPLAPEELAGWDTSSAPKGAWSAHGEAPLIMPDMPDLVRDEDSDDAAAAK